MASSSPGINHTTWNSTMEDVGRGPRAAFLLLFTVVPLVGNIVLLSITTKAPHRRIVQNILIANMCVVGLVDCACNMSIVFGSLVANEWKFGRAVCKANTFFMSLVAVQACIMVFVFSLDRYLVLRFSAKYESWFSSCRLAAVVTVLWAYSIVFSIPYMTDCVPSTFHDQLHICVVTKEISLLFICISSVVCYACPVVATVGLHVAYSRHCKLQSQRKSENNEKPYTQIDKEDGEETAIITYSRHLHSTHLPPILFTLWVILETPFIIRTHTNNYDESLESSSALSYSWKIDALFIWMRFLFTAIFPCLVLLCKKELFQSVKDCCLCRRSNAVVDGKSIFLEPKSPDVLKTDDTVLSVVKKEDKKEQEKENECPVVATGTTAFTAPVLFATSTGICIEESPYRNGSQAKERSEKSGFLLNLTRVKGKALDISYSEYDNPQEFVGDTSDYDSSCDTDMFSISQPVSSRHFQGSLHTNKGRSASNPDITSSLGLQQKNPRSKTRTFPCTSGADSGLDLTNIHSVSALTSVTT